MRIRWRGLELPSQVTCDKESLTATYGKFTAEPFAVPIAGNNIIATASSSNSEAEAPGNTVNASGLDADGWVW